MYLLPKLIILQKLHETHTKDRPIESCFECLKQWVKMISKDEEQKQFV